MYDMYDVFGLYSMEHRHAVQTEVLANLTQKRSNMKIQQTDSDKAHIRRLHLVTQRLSAPLVQAIAISPHQNIWNLSFTCP